MFFENTLNCFFHRFEVGSSAKNNKFDNKSSNTEVLTQVQNPVKNITSYLKMFTI